MGALITWSSSRAIYCRRTDYSGLDSILVFRSCLKDNLVHDAVRGKFRQRNYFGHILEIIINLVECLTICAGFDVGE